LITNGIITPILSWKIFTEFLQLLKRLRPQNTEILKKVCTELAEHQKQTADYRKFKIQKVYHDNNKIHRIILGAESDNTKKMITANYIKSLNSVANDPFKEVILSKFMSPTKLSSCNVNKKKCYYYIYA